MATSEQRLRPLGSLAWRSSGSAIGTLAHYPVPIADRARSPMVHMVKESSPQTYLDGQSWRSLTWSARGLSGVRIMIAMALANGPTRWVIRLSHRLCLATLGEF